MDLGDVATMARADADVIDRHTRDDVATKACIVLCNEGTMLRAATPMVPFVEIRRTIKVMFGDPIRDAAARENAKLKRFICFNEVIPDDTISPFDDLFGTAALAMFNFVAEAWAHTIL